MTGKLVQRPQLGFSEAVKAAWGRLLDFKGRSRRSEFWWFMLAYYIASVVLNAVCGMLLPSIFNTIVGIVLPFFIFAVTVRRLHDTGNSGWWVVISWAATIVIQVYTVVMLPDGMLDSADGEEFMSFISSPVILIAGVIGTITGIATFIFSLLDGKPESNKYGESPKYVTTEEAFGGEQ